MTHRRNVTYRSHTAYCKECGHKFTATYTNKRPHFCSDRCRHHYYDRRRGNAKTD